MASPKCSAYTAGSVMLRLGDVPPDGSVHGHDAWTLRTFWRASECRRKNAGALNGDGGIDDTGHGSYSAERARWVAEKALLAELQRLERERGSLLEAEAVEHEWSDVLRTVRAGMLAVPSRVAQRLPHLTAHDVSEIDSEIRAVLAEIGTS